MAHNFRNSYFDSLPRFKKWTWERSLTAIGSMASIGGSIGLVFKWESLEAREVELYGTLYLFVLVCILLLYILFRETKKRHRYAQAVYHIHFVNHSIRDYLSDLQAGRQEALSSVLSNIVNSIAFCFSIVEGRQCRCSIKEILQVPDLEIRTKARDIISINSTENTNKKRHLLKENTDFHKLWNGEEGCGRFFQGTNLKLMWSRGLYDNSSFQVYGKPERIDVLGYTYITKWTLPYNSTLVLPIRHVPNDEYWPLRVDINRTQLSDYDRPDFWGFLCVDANASNAFSSQESCELGAIFADALYILFKQSAFIARQSSGAANGAGGTEVGGQTIKQEPTSGHHQAAVVENASSKGKAQ